MSALRFASVGSGSRGNAMVIDSGRTRLLLDNGFSLRETLRRLARLGVEPDSLAAVLVTHEHADHAAGVVPLAARHGLPVYLTEGTRQAMAARGHFDGAVVETRRVVRGAAFSVGDIAVRALRVPHDAREPCQYLFERDGARLGVLTDTGSLTPQLLAAYADCDALFLECNHDVQMLASGPYPPPLRARVGGDFGHLNNAQATGLLARVDRIRLQALAIGHVSEKNNCAALARRLAAEAIGWPQERVVMASQSAGHDWLQVFPVQARLAGDSGA